jgi:hypothetical protein
VLQNEIGAHVGLPTQRRTVPLHLDRPPNGSELVAVGYFLRATENQHQTAVNSSSVVNATLNVNALAQCRRDLVAMTQRADIVLALATTPRSHMQRSESITHRCPFPRTCRSIRLRFDVCAVLHLSFAE